MKKISFLLFLIQFVFHFQSFSQCTGTPVGGTTIASTNPVCANSNFTLSISGGSTGTGYTYQWQSSANDTTYANISGATSPTLIKSQTSNTYYHRIITCVSSGMSDTSTSLLVTMNCTATPIGGTTVSNVNPVCSGATFILSLSGASSTCPTYQWQSSPDNITYTNIAGATLATLSRTQTTATYYHCIITCNGSGLSAASAELLVTMNCTATPIGGTTVSNVNPVCSGATFILSLSGSSSTCPTYQWQSSPDNITYTNIAGATLATLSRTQTTATYYHCIITCNGSGLSAASAELLVTMNCTATPIGGTTVSNVNPVCSGATFILSLSGSSSTCPTYQWQSSPDNITYTNIAGATLATLSRTQTTATYYHCIITCNGSGLSAASAELLVTMNCTATPIGGTTVSSVNPVCSGATFILSLSGASSTCPTYQWQSSPDNITYTNIAGATSATLSRTQTTATYYHCIITCNGSGLSATSSNLLVSMNCTSSPVGGTTISNFNPVCSGYSFILSLSGASSTCPAYQWQSSPDNITYTNIAGATAATLTRTQTTATYYHCVVTCNGSTFSVTSSNLLVSMTSGLCSGNAFLQGTFVEVGVGSCGSFGTSVNAPSGYHPRGGGTNPFRLGFVSDPAQDGWSTGTPNYIGDYFVPGTPEEGFGLTINGVNKNNNLLCGVNEIPGSIINYTSTSTEKSAVWQGNVLGINVTSKTYIPVNSLYFVTIVTLTNTSANPINNIYFMRNVDPDNEQTLSGNYTTTNSIVFQNPNSCNQALVSATGLTYGSFLGLGSIDSRARVTKGGFSNRSAINIWNGTGLSTSGTTTADEAISISFNIGSLAPNQSTKFSYAYILSTSQLDKALAATTINFNVNGVNYSTGDSTTICSGGAIPITLTNTGTFTNWTWSPSTGLDTTAGISVTCNISSPITYNVTGTGPCDTVIISISLNPMGGLVPGNAGPITGPTAIALGQTNITYSIAPVTGATYYNWQLPPGSIVTSPTSTANSITFDASNTAWCGHVIVQPASNCGTGASSSLPVSLGNTVSTGTINDTICKGSALNVPYQATITLNPGNIFTAELSDSNGSFTSPVTIGTLASTISGVINAAVPSNILSGTGYRIRVTSSNPVITNCDNGSDITIKSLNKWFADADSDSFGNINVTIFTCSGTPAGYVSDSTDCNDSNPAAHSIATWYLDFDNDGYYASSILSCGSPGIGYTLIPGISGDCNDSNATSHIVETWYLDFDNDGYYASSLSSCGSPGIGYTLVQGISGDCNDSNAAVHSVETWYLDFDNDGYYASSASSCGSPGNGYTLIQGISGDCNDSNPSFHVPVTYYEDTDGDGYYVNQVTVCYNPGTGYTTIPGIAGDCNDGNPNFHVPVTYYLDADGDGYYASSVTVCFNPGSGYTTVQGIPGDCDDNNPAVYPGAPEIADGIDNNCNNQIDEPISCNLILNVTGHDATIVSGNDGSMDIYVNDSLDSCGGIWNIYVFKNGIYFTTIPSSNGNPYTLTGIGAGTYKIKLINPCGCTDSTQLIINEPGTLPCSFKLSNGQITDASCNGYTNGSIVINVSDTTDNCGNSWFINLFLGGVLKATANSSSGNPAVFNNREAGIYSLIGTNACGCKDSADLQINEPSPVQIPVITAPSDSVCAGDSVILSSDIANNIVWSTGVTAQSITVKTSGTYSIIHTDPSGCSSSPATANAYIDVFSVVTNEQAICPGDTATLTVSGNMNSYSWSTGATSQTIKVNPSATTQYYVNAVSATGCSYFDSVTVNVNPVIAPGAVSNMLPQDNSTGLVTPFNLSWLPGLYNTKFDLYIWQFGTSQPSAPTAHNITAINYSVTSQLVNPGIKYNWRVVSKNGNCFSTPGAIQTFTTRFLPDLTVSNVTAPVTAASGQPISVSWTVTNIGNGSTGSATWIDYIWLSLDTILQDNPPATDIYLGGIPNLTALLNGESYVNSATFTVPEGIGGNYHVIVKTNQLGTMSPVFSVVESDNTNNFFITPAFQITLTPPPDLQVTSMIIPINAFSGTTVSVSWTVTNLGADILDSGAAWTDKIYISLFPFLNSSTPSLGQLAHSGNLLHNQSYSASHSITIPNYIFGLYYVFIKTDISDQLYEVPYESNNVKSDVINIYLTPPPDLVPQSFTSPVAATSGEHISIQWTIKNAGANPTDNSWTDKIYLTQNGNYDLTNATQIGTGNSIPSVLNAGDSYNNQCTVTIPNTDGAYYLYVYTDAANSLFEYNMEQNNILRSDTTIVISSPDLTTDVLTIPSSGNSGETISITYRVNNQGSGDVANASRTDKIYVSQQPSFNIGTALLRHTLNFTESIAHGSSVTKQSSFTLPNGISGAYYIYVITDANNSVFENGLDNNNTGRSTGTISVALSPYADLIVQNIQVPDSTVAGFKIPVSFNVQNNGAADAAGTLWQDKIYISPSPVWNVNNAALMGTFTRTQSLVSSASYSITDTVNLQVSQTGHLVVNGQSLDSTFAYIFVFTDATDQIYEHTGENNNVSVSTPVYIIPPRIDLAVTYVYASDSSASGGTASIWWTVKNFGIATSYKGITVPCYWYDGVYLSLDTIFDNSDLFVTDWGYTDLDHDSSYSDSKTFTIPNGVSGTYYVLLVADHTYNLHEDVNRANNYKYIAEMDSATGEVEPEPIEITLTKYPDLELTQMTADANGNAGQPIQVNWSVRNNGPGNTSGTGWQDGVFLSPDFTLDGNDQLIGVKNHPANLDSAQFYTDSMDVFLPINASGNYVLIVATDYNHHIYEYNVENNNTKYSFISINMPPPADLVVTAVNPPLNGIAGESLHINYTIRNIGANPATGVMTDGIYLSGDDSWDITDPLIGTVDNNIVLAPNGQVTRSIDTLITGASLGYYKVIVRTDLLNNIVETNDANNSGASEDSINIDVKLLPMAVLTPDILKNNKYLYYRIEIADSLKGETLLVTLKGDSVHANNEMYLRLGSIPSRAVYDFSHGTIPGGNQQVIVPSLDSGTYYIAVYGSNTASNTQNITLYAEILPFAIRSVNANSGGNTGSVTVQINGSKFVQNMQIKLDNGSGTIVTANSVSYVNTTKLFASFDLRNKPLGIYDVSATKLTSEVALLDDGFEIVQGNSGGFYIHTGSGTGGVFGTADPGCDPHAESGLNSLVQVSLQYPATTRRNRVIAITIFFGNSGNVDIPIPTRFVYALDGAPLSYSVDSLTLNLHDLYLEFKEQGGPPDVLRPGATGAITIYTKAIAPLNFILSE